MQIIIIRTNKENLISTIFEGGRDVWQKEKKKKAFKRLVSGLTKTRDNIVSGFDSILADFPISMTIFMRN